MKPEKVIFINQDLERSFTQLKPTDPLKKSLTNSIKNLQEEAFCGRNVKKKLIPKKLKEKYKLQNLWIYNLPNAWRMLYTISSNEVKVIAVILNWMNHKDYEKLFNFT